MAHLTQVGEDCHPSSLDPWAEVPKERLGLWVYTRVSLPCALWYLSTCSCVMPSCRREGTGWSPGGMLRELLGGGHSRKRHREWGRTLPKGLHQPRALHLIASGDGKDVREGIFACQNKMGNANWMHSPQEWKATWFLHCEEDRFPGHEGVGRQAMRVSSLRHPAATGLQAD